MTSEEILLPKVKPKFVIKKWFPWHEYNLKENYCSNEENEITEYHWSGAQSLESYSGPLVNGAMHGYGEYRWRYKNLEQFITYEGYFYANRLHGYGVMSYPDGRTFTGLFKRDVRWGPGVEMSVNGHSSLGFWVGPRLIRLPWRPPTLKIFPDFITGPNGQEFLFQFRKVLSPKIINIGSSSINAIDLLMSYGCDPQRATEIWPKIYSKCCTDPDSIFFNKDLFDNKYYKRRISTLEEADVLYRISIEDLINPPKRFLAWNNGSLMMDIMKHCFQYEMQRPPAINLERILNGSKHSARKEAKHEVDCRSLLMASFLGNINLVAKFVNRRYVCPDVTDMDGNSAIMYAVCGDQFQVCQFLAVCGASVNCPNDQGYTPLSLSLMRYLIAYNGIGNRNSASWFLPPVKVENNTVQEEWLMNLIKVKRIDSHTLPGKKPTKVSKPLRSREASKGSLDLTQSQKRHSSSGFKTSNMISEPPGQLNTVLPSVDTQSMQDYSDKLSMLDTNKSVTFLSLILKDEDTTEKRTIDAIEPEIDQKTIAKPSADITPLVEIKSPTEIEPQSELEAETKPQAEIESQAEIKPEAEIKPLAETKLQAKIKTHTAKKPQAEIKSSPDTKNKVKMSLIEGTDDYRKEYLALQKEYINKINEELSTPANKPRYMFQVDDIFSKSSKHDDSFSKKTHSLDSEADRHRYESMAAAQRTITQLLTDGADPKLVRCPWPAILMAIKTGSPQIVRLIAENGADVNEYFPEQLNYTAIDIIMGQPLTSENVEMIRTLIECGANVKHILPYNPVLAQKSVLSRIRLETPTLFHVLLMKATQGTAYDHVLAEEVLELLLQHGCDPFTMFDGQSAIEMAMNKDLRLLNAFINHPDVNLNKPINISNQSVLLKLYHPEFSEKLAESNSQELIPDLLLHGADPLIPCQDGDRHFENLFSFIENVQSGTPVTKLPKTFKKSRKLKSFATNLDALLGYTRLWYIRRIHGQLMNDIVNLAYRFRSWQWRMLIKEHKNKLGFAMWVTPERCFELWNIFQTAKKKKFQDDAILQNILCLLIYYQKQMNDNVEIGSKPLTITEKIIIEAEVKNLIKEHKKRTRSSTLTNVTDPYYSVPELSFKELQDAKYNICFECLLPLDTRLPELILRCVYCGLVGFCNYICLLNNNKRQDCHPCNEKLVLFYALPSSPGECSLELNISTSAVNIDDRTSFPNIDPTPSRSNTVDVTIRNDTATSNISNRRVTVVSDSSGRGPHNSRRATLTSESSRRATFDINIDGQPSSTTHNVSKGPSVASVDNKQLKSAIKMATTLPGISKERVIKGVGYDTSVAADDGTSSNHRMNPSISKERTIKGVGYDTKDAAVDGTSSNHRMNPSISKERNIKGVGYDTKVAADDGTSSNHPMNPIISKKRIIKGVGYDTKDAAVDGTSSNQRMNPSISKERNIKGVGYDTKDAAVDGTSSNQRMNPSISKERNIKGVGYDTKDAAVDGTSSNQRMNPSISKERNIKGVGYDTKVAADDGTSSNHRMNPVISKERIIKGDGYDTKVAADDGTSSNHRTTSRHAMGSRSAIKHFDKAIKNINSRLKAMQTIVSEKLQN